RLPPPGDDLGVRGRRSVAGFRRARLRARARSRGAAASHRQYRVLHAAVRDRRAGIRAAGGRRAGDRREAGLVRRLLAILLAILPLAAWTRELPAPVAEALARAGVAPTAVAALVIPADPLDRGAALVSHNVSQPMNPASVVKIVTA